MMRRGWFGENYRHYLAGKGISTSVRAKNRKFVTMSERMGFKRFYVDPQTGRILAANTGGRGEINVSPSELQRMNKASRIVEVKSVKPYLAKKDVVDVVWDEPYLTSPAEGEVQEVDFRQKRMRVANEQEARMVKKFIEDTDLNAENVRVRPTRYDVPGYSDWERIRRKHAGTPIDESQLKREHGKIKSMEAIDEEEYV